MKTVTIEGQLRTEFGKKATRQIRSQEQVPAVIYGGAQEVNFAASLKSFKPLVYTPEFQLAEIKVGEKTYKCILKDLQFDKVTDELIHIDLLELVDDKKVIANLPLKYTGNSIGVKDGGKLVLKMKSVKVKTYPKYLKENLEVDITNLNINGNLRVEDIKADNIEIMNSPRIPIASVVMTRQLKQEEATKDEKKK
ncbi:MAG TPA: 50S ribosomal protein L25 [Chitinophagaceae bacterium]|nr:50S ribosomal protein L25 [Chitinophagaceae bacterium]MCC6635251.1 50S ribosomal protein L25 [Chitinophagaceae bacterium]HMZ45876.1 50S ribosomal protein L25 [Chitinophagaceae bacterium]HNE93795.1 50S ribosomal protein L25 [Chitinophagaceae bacterium]HNJ58019.1 50S ribosomal protein L25 [Chitinophagaceae bacterium]